MKKIIIAILTIFCSIPIHAVRYADAGAQFNAPADVGVQANAPVDAGVQAVPLVDAGIQAIINQAVNQAVNAVNRVVNPPRRNFPRTPAQQVGFGVWIASVFYSLIFVGYLFFGA